MGDRTVPLRVDDAEYEIIAQAKRLAEAKAGQDLTWTEFVLLMANDTSAKWRAKQ